MNLCPSLSWVFWKYKNCELCRSSLTKNKTGLYHVYIPIKVSKSWQNNKKCARYANFDREQHSFYVKQISLECIYKFKSEGVALFVFNYQHNAPIGYFYLEYFEWDSEALIPFYTDAIGFDKRSKDVMTFLSNQTRK